MSVFSELKRRNVIRTGMAYVLGVFALIEATDLLVPILSAPVWAPQVVFFSAALGFPVVLVLAWFYEVTPEGIKPAGDVEMLEPVAFMGRKIDFAIIGLLVLALGFVVVDNYVLTEPERERSIAVLPFTNLSAAEEQNAEFFSTGMHDALLTQLAKLDGIKVISRTSVLEYADAPKNMRQIGEELGVATILEGSVLRDGDALQINVQLIDAQTDEHLWAELYERELTAGDIFATQRDMALAIADALQATLSPEEINRLTEVPTQNLRAYDFYLSGKAYDSGDRGSGLPRMLQFERAVAEDPDFVLAWVELIDSYADLARHGNLDPEESERRWSQSRDAIEHVLRLAPDSAEAHYATARSLNQAGEREAALEAIILAEQRMPGAAFIHKQQALLLVTLGRRDEAAIKFARTLQLDPKDAHALMQQGHNYADLRNYEQAEQSFDRVLELVPNHRFASGWKLLVQMLKGDIAAMKAAIDELRFLTARERRSWDAAFRDRDLQSALSYLEAWDGEGYSWSWRNALTYLFLSEPPDRELAEQHLQAALDQLDDADAEDDISRLDNMTRGAELRGYLGDREAAGRIAREALRHLPEVRIDDRQDIRETIIWALIAAEDYDLAIRELDTYLDNPGLWSIEGLQLDPRLDPLRQRPDFLTLVEKYGRGD